MIINTILVNCTLCKSKAYLDIRDSLSYVLSERVSEARKKPNGIGRQIIGAKPINDPKRIYSKK